MSARRTTRSAAAASNQRTRVLVSSGICTHDLADKRTVPPNRDRPISVRDDVLAAPRAARDEIELAVVCAANRLREQLGPPGRDDDAAISLEDDPRSLTVWVGRDDNGPANGQDAVQPARHDIACQPACEADDMHV